MRSIAERLAYNRRHQYKLNPVLFDDENKMKPLVQKKILRIVDEFLSYIQVDIKVADIRLVGSNASYNYNPNSDLDIHIVTDLSSVSKPETIARLYFDSIKKDFKEAYDIRIKGIYVELYVEDINTTSVSNGVYSVLKEKWIKSPTPVDEPDESTLEDAERIEEEIIEAIKNAESVEELEEIIDRVYLLRKDSLSSDGEMSAGNLAFKSLRNKGILDKIKDVLRSKKSKELSMESKSLEEDVTQFRVGNTTYSRDKRYGVGKKMGTQVYFHKDYADRVCPELYREALRLLKKKDPEFKFNCLMYDTTKPTVLRFDEAPDFDTAREPITGAMRKVDVSTGEVKSERPSTQIWHHKWMWVMDDYKGFDVQSSYDWSKKWTQYFTKPSGYMNKWKAALADAGLE